MDPDEQLVEILMESVAVEVQHRERYYLDQGAGAYSDVETQKRKALAADVARARADLLARLRGGP
jgi:polysaccharide deacetylase 2 family uncharacterized protein YibQ